MVYYALGHRPGKVENRKIKRESRNLGAAFLSDVSLVCIGYMMRDCVGALGSAHLQLDDAYFLHERCTDNIFAENGFCAKTYSIARARVVAEQGGWH